VGVVSVAEEADVASAGKLLFEVGVERGIGVDANGAVLKGAAGNGGVIIGWNFRQGRQTHITG
jgi:hypothetical protein